MTFVCLTGYEPRTGARRETVGEWLERPVKTEVVGNTELSWFDEIMRGSHIAVKSATMVAAYVAIQSLLERKDFAVLDSLLSSAAPKEMAPESMVGVLRYSFAARDRLRHWQPFRDEVSEELASRGINTKAVLRGLHAGGTAQPVR